MPPAFGEKQCFTRPKNDAYLVLANGFEVGERLEIGQMGRDRHKRRLMLRGRGEVKTLGRNRRWVEEEGLRSSDLTEQVVVGVPVDAAYRSRQSISSELGLSRMPA